MKQTLKALGIAAAMILNLGQSASANMPSYIIEPNAQWEYFARPDRVPSDWKTDDRNASAWPVGDAGFGFGDNDDQTTLSDMRGVYDKVYIRRKFHLDSVPEQMFLYMRYDDAFIAYVNGKEVFRASVDKDGDVSSHEADTTEIFALRAKHFVEGDNLLAIVGINRSATSSDFSLSPALSASPYLLHVIPKDQAVEQLTYLKDRMLSQSSYLKANDTRDPIGLIDRTIPRLPELIAAEAVYRAMKQVVAQIPDGHGRVRFNPAPDDDTMYLPFSLADTSGGLVAVDARAGEFTSPSHIYVTKIDGIDIGRWIDTSKRYEANASPQLNRRRAIRSVSNINFLRYDLDIASSAVASVTFANEQGETKTEEISLTTRRPRTAQVVKKDSQILADNVGYLRLPQMNRDLIPEFLGHMAEFKDTKALIIDVRDNGGGRLEILRALAPFFLPSDHGPILSNIAAYRLAPIFDKDHLFDRPTLPLSHSTWSAQERAVIEKAFASFIPEWPLPEDEFSEWHFQLLNRTSDRRDHHYHYDRPVIVLANAASFSATDGFVSGFHLLPDVTIIGKPTGGGSGRGRTFEIPNSFVSVRLSSMASFRSNGKLFDRSGVEVDIDIDPLPTDFIGQSDVVLERALELSNRE